MLSAFVSRALFVWSSAVMWVLGFSFYSTLTMWITQQRSPDIMNSIFSGNHKRSQTLSKLLYYLIIFLLYLLIQILTQNHIHIYNNKLYCFNHPIVTPFSIHFFAILYFDCFFLSHFFIWCTWMFFFYFLFNVFDIIETEQMSV